MHIRGFVTGLWPKGVETIERVEEVVRTSQSDASSGEWGGGRGAKVVPFDDARYTGNQLFELRLRVPCTRECCHKQVSRSSNTEENPGTESADTYKQQVRGI